MLYDMSAALRYEGYETNLIKVDVKAVASRKSIKDAGKNRKFK